MKENNYKHLIFKKDKDIWILEGIKLVDLVVIFLAG